MATLLETPAQSVNDWVGSARHNMSSSNKRVGLRPLPEKNMEPAYDAGLVWKLVLIVGVLAVFTGLFIGRSSAVAVLITSLIPTFAFQSTVASARQDALAEAKKVEMLRQKVRKTDEFMASLAHDMRTPLTTVEMYGRMLSDAEHISDIQRTHMSKMLLSSKEALLDLIERVPERRYALVEKRFDIGKSTRDAVNLINVQAIKKGINVRANKIDTDIEVKGSPALMRRAILNLLSNAIKYTPEGGEVFVSVRREADSATIDIQDTGIGIPEDELPFIFDSFTRGSTHDEGIEGKGLGLAVVQHVVDAHHGVIEVKSKAGEGSLFTLCLPLAEEVALAQVEQENSA